jgi:hypothetical protein
VQAARHLVRVGVELAARVQDRHDHFSRGAALFGMDAHRNAAPIVIDADRTVVVNRHFDVIAVPGQRLVDGVVHHLEHHMVQPGAIIGVADVHAGPFTDRFQPLQDLDAAGIVDFVHDGYS